MSPIDLSLENILSNMIPLGFGLIGIVVLLIGVINMISGKDISLGNIFSGLFIILVAVGLGWLMRVLIVPNLL
jgi:hypothetical protein